MVVAQRSREIVAHVLEEKVAHSSPAVMPTVAGE